jgi:transposase
LQVETPIALIEDVQSSLPDSVRVILKLLVDTFTALEAPIAALDAEINQHSKSDATARRLVTIPGVGPITSTVITALVPAASGFPAAWLGLTPLAEIDRWQAKNSVPFRNAVNGRSAAC